MSQDQPDPNSTKSYKQQRSRRQSGKQHPLGPMMYRSAKSDHRSTRLTSLLVIAASATLLVVSAWLTPDPSGMDTHTQLGLPKCGWPTSYGIPCPTCGMTTSFALLVRGSFIDAFATQPLGAMLALMTIAALIWGIAALITGRRWRVNFYRCTPGRIIFGGVLTVLAAWGYKILSMG